MKNLEQRLEDCYSNYVVETREGYITLASCPKNISSGRIGRNKIEGSYSLYKRNHKTESYKFIQSWLG